MDKIKILWADDEIDLLKPHILFLETKGFEVTAVTNGAEAVEEATDKFYSLIFLDENMPGMTGLETLYKIKRIRPEVPVVMITKSEEEMVMEDAIGSQISDYLIKPVNPKQILLTVKKLVDTKRLVSEKITLNYQQDFRELSMSVNEQLNAEEWMDVYRKLVHWDIELEKSDDETMKDVLVTQKSEANSNFSRFVENNYVDWINDPDNAPLMSPRLLSKKLIPLLDNGKPTVFLLIDNLRYDQWRIMQPKFSELFNIKDDSTYFSILPTATNYARNSIFTGMMPSEIAKRYPKLWVNDEDEGGKNLNEQEFIGEYLKRARKDIRFSYNKITNLEAGKSLVDNASNILNNDLAVVIYNFVDLLSHVRTEMQVLKELAEDEPAYRSLTFSWFEHSPLYDFLKKVASKKVNLVLTTDHGSVRVKRPSKIIGDRNTTTNLRYKQGKNLNFDAKAVLHVKEPDDILLPAPFVSSSYVFAKEDNYFVYPNNYNYYVNFFKDTFQHGGISLEEMIIPVITMESKGS
ncbi:MAG: bifunctional response regulator/alkaline phosphatase family protein [Bacteroidia bacterium]